MNKSAVPTPTTVSIRSSIHIGPLALTLPAALAFLLFLAAPLTAFFVFSFLTPGLFDVSGPTTLASYREALTSSLNGILARNSLFVGLLSALVTVGVALPVAYWLRYRAGRWAVPILFLITASMFASYLVRIYAWRTILGANGFVNQTLEYLGLIDEPLGFLLFSRFAITVALVHIFLPYVILVLYAGLRPLTPALLESAQDLGANALVRWRRVILPLVAAPAVTAFFFVFILSASDYVTPQFLGGTSSVMLGVRIQDSFKATGNWSQGAAISFLMLAAFLVLYGLTALGLRAKRLDRIRWMS